MVRGHSSSMWLTDRTFFLKTHVIFCEQCSLTAQFSTGQGRLERGWVGKGKGEGGGGGARWRVP